MGVVGRDRGWFKSAFSRCVEVMVDECMRYFWHILLSSKQSLVLRRRLFWYPSIVMSPIGVDRKVLVLE